MKSQYIQLTYEQLGNLLACNSHLPSVNSLTSIDNTFWNEESNNNYHPISFADGEFQDPKIQYTDKSKALMNIIYELEQKNKQQEYVISQHLETQKILKTQLEDVRLREQKLIVKCEVMNNLINDYQKRIMITGKPTIQKMQASKTLPATYRKQPYLFVGESGAQLVKLGSRTKIFSQQNDTVSSIHHEL